MIRKDHFFCSIIFNFVYNKSMNIRHATERDIWQLAQIESRCFPEAEAASAAEIAHRVQYYGNHFWLAAEKQGIVSFADGFVTDYLNLTDAMYEHAEMHNEKGHWQMIFGVNTLPEYRNQGYATAVLNAVIEDCRKQHRSGIVLTCKEHMIPYYARFGFIDEGVTDLSMHGGAVWYQMRRALDY
jgi:predicted N-acetyltransferase YhbS